MKRDRTIYALLVALVITAGLASRRYPDLLPVFMRKGTGDALWALMVFLLAGMIRPGAKTAMLGAVALLISYLDEFSQMYQAPWIDAIRDTIPGRLVLGSGFNWGELGWYTVGVAFGVVAEITALRYKAKDMAADSLNQALRASTEENSSDHPK